MCYDLKKLVNKSLSSTIWSRLVLAFLNFISNATFFIIQKGLPSATLAPPKISTVWKAKEERKVRLLSSINKEVLLPIGKASTAFIRWTPVLIFPVTLLDDVLFTIL